MNQHSLRHFAFVAVLAALVAPATVWAQAAPPIDGVIENSSHLMVRRSTLEHLRA